MVATNLAYPLADLLLVSLVVAMFALTGWRLDSTWGFIVTGLPSSPLPTAPTSTRPPSDATSRAVCSTSGGPPGSC